MFNPRHTIAAAEEKEQVGKTLAPNEIRELCRIANEALDEVDRLQKCSDGYEDWATLYKGRVERLAAVARAMLPILALAHIGAKASASSSSHQEFIREDKEAIAAAEIALANLQPDDKPAA